MTTPVSGRVHGVRADDHDAARFLFVALVRNRFGGPAGFRPHRQGSAGAARPAWPRHTQSILSEWNYGLSDKPPAPLMRASFIASSLIYMEDAPVDAATLYRADNVFRCRRGFTGQDRAGADCTRPDESDADSPEGHRRRSGRVRSRGRTLRGQQDRAGPDQQLPDSRRRAGAPAARTTRCTSPMSST